MMRTHDATLSWGNFAPFNVGDRLTFGFPVFGYPAGFMFWCAPGRKIIPYPSPLKWIGTDDKYQIPKKRP